MGIFETRHLSICSVFPRPQGITFPYLALDFNILSCGWLEAQTAYIDAKFVIKINLREKQILETNCSSLTPRSLGTSNFGQFNLPHHVVEAEEEK